MDLKSSLVSRTNQCHVDSQISIVFQAEVTAILIAFIRHLNIKIFPQTIFIYSESQAAIESLTKVAITSKLILELRISLLTSLLINWKGYELTYFQSYQASSLALLPPTLNTILGATTKSLIKSSVRMKGSAL